MMKRRHNEGFSLVEVLVAMVVLALVVIPVCSSLVMSFRMNAKADEMMQAQLAVSSAVETLMAEGITEKFAEDVATDRVSNKFPGVEFVVEPATNGSDTLPYYNVTVTDTAELVEIETCIRAAAEQTTPTSSSESPDGGEEGGGT